MISYAGMFVIKITSSYCSEELTDCLSCTQKSLTQDNIRIFMTPRKLIHSLQDPNDEISDCSEKVNRRIKSLSSGNIMWSPASFSKYDQNMADHVNFDSKENGGLYGDVKFQGGPESVSSTDDNPITSDIEMPSEVGPESGNGTETVLMGKPFQKTKQKLVCGISFALLAIATPLLWINSQDEGHFLVPT